MKTLLLSTGQMEDSLYSQSIVIVYPTLKNAAITVIPIYGLNNDFIDLEYLVVVKKLTICFS